MADYGLVLDSGAVIPLKAKQRRAALKSLQRHNQAHRQGKIDRANAGPFDPPVIFPRLAVGLMRIKVAR